MRTIWGTINANGTILSGSQEADGRFSFSCNRQATGQYAIGFRSAFSGVPAIVGTQTRFGSLNQDPRDGTVFPFLDETGATAIVGSSNGSPSDRNFSFIVNGEGQSANAKFKE